jgi:predicted ribosome quality control (RQC) complex YloA/Tae2 family protein
MDLFVIRGIVGELQQEIGGGFVTKIYQMNRTDLLIRVRRQGEEKNLVLSTHPEFSRLHLSARKYANPQVPPRFCTYLRKHITGARVSRVNQDPYERVVRIELQKNLDAGLRRELTLAVELLGKGSNVLLLEGEKILDCLHFRRNEEGTTRPALPGLVYTPLPRGDRLSLPEVTREKIEETLRLPAQEREKALVVGISGISPNLAREILAPGEGREEQIWENFRRLREVYESGSSDPRILTFLNGKKVLSPFPLKSAGPVAEDIFPSLNSAADAYYFETVMRRQLEEKKQSLLKRIRALLGRLERRKDNLLLDRGKFAKDLGLKSYGDLLVAHFPQLKKGMREIEVRDYGCDPPASILIPLEEALDPAGNVDRYFGKYKKAKRGIEMVSARLEETQKELEYLESAYFQIEAAEDQEELETVRGELEGERILPVSRQRKPGKEKEEPALPVRRFRSSDGLEIFCGKSNLGNDYLLRKLARGNDLWFHAQGYPGSHVLLKTGPGDPKFEAIAEAATIAAFFSRGKGSTRVPVDYTPARNVHRPKGARPGFVTYLHQKTVFVNPDKEKVEKLRRA